VSNPLRNVMNRHLLALALLSSTAAATTLYAQVEGPAPTQALVSFDSKAPVLPTTSNMTIKIDNKASTILNIAPVPSNNAQIALLIDDGLRTSIGRELDTLRDWVQNLPAGTEVFVGYMQNGRIVTAAGAVGGFTTDHAAAASTLRISQGIAGVSASPYFSLSDFVKNWPGQAEVQQPRTQAPANKARFVLMITNGVDPYNGSTSILNQNSPYVTRAISDAQNAGVPVYSIYFSDAGFANRRERNSFSGQSYLSQVADGTGGVAFFQGLGNPVSLSPFLKEFQQDVAETFVATFPVNASKNMARVKFSTSLPKTKVRAPDQVRAGTVIFQP
jgi:hypothetical protein